MLSMAMVFLFLPALLTLFDKLIERTTLRAVFADTTDTNTTDTAEPLQRGD
jgi:hypothetical protein